MENIDRLLEDGCWWANSWWEESHWYDAGLLNKRDVVGAIDFLKTIFPVAWVKSLGDDPLQHPFLRMILLGQGLFQLNNIYWFAERLRVVTKIDGHRAVIESYKSITQAHRKPK